MPPAEPRDPFPVSVPVLMRHLGTRVYAAGRSEGRSKRTRRISVTSHTAATSAVVTRRLLSATQSNMLPRSRRPIP